MLRSFINKELKDNNFLLTYKVLKCYILSYILMYKKVKYKIWKSFECAIGSQEVKVSKSVWNIKT